MNILQNLIGKCKKIWYSHHYYYDDDYNKDYTENSSMKFIWGLKSYDDLSSCGANLYTMNDIDLIYLKDAKKYILGVETVYLFKTKEDEQNYFKTLLENFTVWMNKQGYDINNTLNPYGDMHSIFTSGYNINTHFDTIEDAYRIFKFLVNGYLTL